MKVCNTVVFGILTALCTAPVYLLVVNVVSQGMTTVQYSIHNLWLYAKIDMAVSSSPSIDP